jgi:mono/diheme cytochrome c family protein
VRAARQDRDWTPSDPRDDPQVGALHRRAKENGDGMQLAGGRPLFRNVTRILLLIGVVTLAVSPATRAENLDEGKAAPRLFADGCSACHHSARGLAKGRFTVTLYLFLQQHYASNSSSAWALASYLASVDQGPRDRSHSAMRRPSPSRTSGSSLRPPMPIPQH